MSKHAEGNKSGNSFKVKGNANEIGSQADFTEES